MKEATGELNMTVITVVAIAAVGAFFYAIVWPSVQSNIALSTACSSVNSKGVYESKGEDGTSISCSKTNGLVTCEYKDAAGVVKGTKNCD